MVNKLVTVDTKNPVSLKKISEHYNRSEVRKTILRFAEPEEGFRGLNGDRGWYASNTANKVRLRTAEDYDNTVERFRTLYSTLDVFGHHVKQISKTWDKEKEKPIEPIGTLEDCLGYTLSVDIDSIKGPNGEDITNSDEIRTAVEDAGQFFVDYLRDREIEKSVHCLYSGGGMYVHLHHALFSPTENWKPEDRGSAFRSLTEAFNGLIAEIETAFFQAHPEHEGRVKFDKINNQKRIFKCIFSIHAKHDLAVIPLDPSNIKIDIEQAKLPLSDEIIKAGEEWYQSYDSDELSKVQHLLAPFMVEQQKPREDIDPDGMTEIKSIYQSPKPIQLDKFPPCIKNIIENVGPGPGRHRALSVLASFLYSAGWSDEEAFSLWGDIAHRAGVESRIFDQIYGKITLANCKTLQKTTSGYPRVGLGGLDYCVPDERCGEISWPGNYANASMSLDEAMELVTGIKERVKADPGLPFKTNFLEALAVIKVQDQVEFERVKAELRKARVSFRPLSAKIEEKISELNLSGTSDGCQNPGDIASDKQTVELGNDLAENIDKSLQALYVNNNPPVIFQRGGTLCRIKSIDTNQSKVEDVTDYGLLTEMSRAAIFREPNRDGTMRKCKPGINLAKGILAHPGWEFPVLKGLVSAPVVRPDGSLLLEPGYDAATGLFYISDPDLVMPAIPENPTKEDAKKAADFLITEVLFDFPFCGTASLANTVAMFLTPIIRPMIKGCIPLGLVSKPSPGTGATKLFEMVSMISTGRPMKAQTAPTDEEEWRKKITSLLRAGSHIITFDNVDSDLGSGMLASALTSLVWEDRVLGRSESVDYPQRASWYANGNNLTLKGDLARRSYLVQLDAEMAHPWERKTKEFRHPDLEKWVAEHRGELLAALLTVVRAWVIAGKPDGCNKVVGGFEEWTKIVGSIISYAGVTGFLKNEHLLHAELDAGVDEWGEFIQAWYDRYEDQSLTSSALVDDLLNPASTIGKCVPSEVAEKINFRTTGNAIKLALVLRKKLNVHFGNGLVLKQTRDKSAKKTLWQVIKAVNYTLT